MLLQGQLEMQIPEVPTTHMPASHGIRLTLLRFPLILGVVFIHNQDTTVRLADSQISAENAGFVADFTRHLVSEGVSRLAVPLFFLISGYFFFRGFSGTRKAYFEKLQRRVHTLLIPYLLWSTCALLFYALAQALPATRGFFSGRTPMIDSLNLSQIAKLTFGLGCNPIVGQFWFLRDLMLLTLLVPPLHFFLKRIPTVFLCAVFTCWLFEEWPVYMPAVEAVLFFSAGACVAIYGGNLFFFDRSVWLLALVYVPVVLADAIPVAFPSHVYLHKAGLVLGVPLALSMSMHLLKSSRVQQAGLWLGSMSFFIYAFHEPYLTVLRKLIYNAFRPTSSLSILAIYFTLPVVVVLSSILIYQGLRRCCPRGLAVISGGR